MKQFWLGIFLLAVLLVSGLWLGDRMSQIHEPQARDLEKAAQCARDGNWELASALMTRAKNSWGGSRNLTAALIHHDPVNDIDVRFAQIVCYAADRNGSEFSASCVSLAQVLRSLSQPHRLSWWNLL